MKASMRLGYKLRVFFGTRPPGSSSVCVQRASREHAMAQPGKPLRAQNNTDSLLLHSCMLQALEALPRVND